MNSWKQSVLLFVAGLSLLAASEQSYSLYWATIGLAVVTPGYGGAVAFGRSATGLFAAAAVACSALWVLLTGPPAAVTNYLLGGLIGVAAIDLVRHRRASDGATEPT